MAFDLFKGIFGGDDYYGSRPEVPDWEDINIAKLQKQAMQDNLASFGRAKKIGKKVNRFNQQQLLSMLKRGIPQYNQLVKAGSQQALSLLKDENIAAWRQGKIPQDVVDEMATRMAERGVGRGTNYSAGGPFDAGFDENDLARQYGLKSLDLIAEGFKATQGALSSTEKWLANTAAMTTPGLFNVTSMFLDPMQRYQIAAQERSGKFARDWLEAQVEAAPNPVDRGRFDTEMTILGMALGTIGSWGLGGGGGGGKGGGGGGGTQYTNVWKPNWNTLGTPSSTAPTATTDTTGMGGNPYLWG